MSSLLKYGIIICTLVVLSCQNQEEINAAAQTLFEQKLKEHKIAADEACLEKRATYVTMYKDSLSQANKLVGDE